MYCFLVKFFYIFFKINVYLFFFIFMLYLDCNAGVVYKDPFELFNKRSYFINKKLDKLVLRPAAVNYLKIMPNFLVKNFCNVIRNYNELSNVTHSFLQFNFNNLFNNSIRYVCNSFFSFFGFFDITTSLNVLYLKEDYGKTLKRFGYNKSLYLVLPVLGSCTIRDLLSLLINNDFIVNKFYLDEYIKYYYILYILYERVFLLDSEKIFFEVSVDEYVLLKNVYLQYINYQYNK